jgi:hypothetical protein
MRLTNAPPSVSRLSRTGMSKFKQVVIDFLVSKLPVMYHSLLLSYGALSKNIGKNNATRGKYRLTILVSGMSTPAFHAPSVGRQLSTA